MKCFIHYRCIFFASAILLQGAPSNALLIVSEDHGPELGCYGDPYVCTLNLNQHARSPLGRAC